MSKINYINEFLKKNPHLNSDLSILNALIIALSVNESCSFFDLTFQQNQYARRYLLKKISSDMIRSYSACHDKLIISLIEQLNQKGFIKRESCASSIDLLFDYLPTKYQKKIINTFITSTNKSNRNRAYKRINSKWSDKFRPIVERAWNTHHDYYCLNIILNHFPVDYLTTNYKTFLFLMQPHQVARMFLKLSSVDQSLTKELLEIDPISYSYVLTKLNLKLSEEEANKILIDNYADERIGLLLWCFGHMGLWNTIVLYNEQFETKNRQARMNYFVSQE